MLWIKWITVAFFLVMGISGQVKANEDENIMDLKNLQAKKESLINRQLLSEKIVPVEIKRSPYSYTLCKTHIFSPSLPAL